MRLDRVSKKDIEEFVKLSCIRLSTNEPSFLMPWSKAKLSDDLQLDSLDKTELVMDLESQFCVELNIVDTTHWVYISNVVDDVWSKLIPERKQL